MGKSEKQKKYIHTVELRNETEFDDIFDSYKDEIRELITDGMSAFDFDIDLLVIFRTMDEDRSFVTAETTDGATTMIDGKYAVILNIYSLLMIDGDGGQDLSLSVRHELGHVYDLYHTMHNKFYEIDPLKPYHEDIDDFVIAHGSRFWSEYYAYSMTYKIYKTEYGYPTFLQLVKGYERLQRQYALMRSVSDFESESAQAELENFTDNIERLSYAIAKHLAGCIKGKPYNYEYSDKTKDSEAFVAMEDLLHGFLKKLLPLYTNTYGKGMANKLYELGKYLIKRLYGKFDICPTEYNDRIHFAFYK